MEHLQRFGLRHNVFPQDASRETFFDAVPGYERLRRRFTLLAHDPGVGLLTADTGMGKTSAVRNLCAQLPRPDYKIAYVSDTAIQPLGILRQIASELGVVPIHRRAQLFGDLKAAIAHMVDEQGVQPILILDDAHELPDRFLLDLGRLLNFTMDSRNLLTLWLVGHPELRARLRLNHYASLASRIAAKVQLEPIVERERFAEFLGHGLAAAGATETIFSDTAKELLFRACRGVPRRAHLLVDEALLRAHERAQSFVDETILEEILDEEQP
jgi:type II secretory pathway predicted ATPase ExeA